MSVPDLFENFSNTKMPILPTLCFVEKLDHAVVLTTQNFVAPKRYVHFLQSYVF